MDKPLELYRGVSINYENLEKFKFSGVDMFPPEPPIIDGLGRKVNDEGSEYGVYMSDNDRMSLEAYSRGGKQTVLDKNYRIGSKIVALPNVQVLYKINPDNISVHKPFLSSVMGGLEKNNGYAGEEWIAERIPASEYSMASLSISEDILHDKETIDPTNIQEAEVKTREIVEKRKQHLEFFLSDMKRRYPNGVQLMYNEDIKILKDIYGDNGAAYLKGNEELITGEDYIKFLINKNIKENPDKLDFNTLRYLEGVKSSLPKDSKAEDVITALQKERDDAILSKENMAKNQNVSLGSFPQNSGVNRRIINASLYMESVMQEQANRKGFGRSNSGFVLTLLLSAVSIIAGIIILLYCI